MNSKLLPVLGFSLLALTACQPGASSGSASSSSSRASSVAAASSSRAASQAYVHSSGDFSFQIPAGWYAHDLTGSVIFTKSANFTLPQGTEGYAIGPQFTVRVAVPSEITGATTFEGWMTGNGMVRGSEWLKALSTVRNDNGVLMERAEMSTAQTDDHTLTYVHRLPSERYVVISHYPYVEGSADSSAFDDFVQSFQVTAADSSFGSDEPLPAFRAAQSALAAKLKVKVSDVTIVSAEPHEWTDGCLGLGSPVENCIQAITSGYIVTLRHDGKDHVYHVNNDGQNVRARN